MTNLLSLLIICYQKISRFLLPKACRFYPSCSTYALEALEKHGLIKGSAKALIRIFKCSPFSPGGYDPI